MVFALMGTTTEGGLRRFTFELAGSGPPRTTMVVVAVHNAGNTVLLIALATTLPRQIEMTYELHLLASGWNDFISIWARLGGVAANMLPQPDQKFDERIKFDRLVLREGEHANVVHRPDAHPHGSRSAG